MPSRAREAQNAPLGKNRSPPERPIFFIRPQALEATSKNALAYDGWSSGPIIYVYVGGNPISNVDPEGLWSVTFGGYAGPGFQITAGNANGNGFMTARVGFVLGGGFSYNPAGGLPGEAPNDPSKGGVVAACSAKASFNAGPLQTSAELGGARNFNNGSSSWISPFAGSGRFSNGWLGGGSIWNLNANANVGAQITIYSGKP